MTVASQEPVDTADAIERLREAVTTWPIEVYFTVHDLQAVLAELDRLLAERDAALARAEEAEREAKRAQRRADYFMDWLAQLGDRATQLARGGVPDDLSEASSPVSDPVSQIGTTLDRWSQELKGCALGEELAHLAAKVRRGDYLTPAAGTET
jgi:hypothetical protein